MEFLFDIIRGLSIETVSAVVIGLFALFNLNLRKKSKQLGDVVDELTSALEDGKIDEKELKAISVKASVLFGKK